VNSLTFQHSRGIGFNAFEQRRADANNGGAFFDCYLEIATHAHRKLVERDAGGAAGSQAVAKLAQGGKIAASLVENLAFVFLLAIGIAVIASIVLAGSIARPVMLVTSGVERLAQGELREDAANVAGMARAEQLGAAGKLHRGATGTLAWSQPRSPAARVGLRSASSETFVIADGRDGSVLGTIEGERVFRSAHPGAVYLHMGDSYLVRHLDLDAASVMVEPFSGAYYTQPKVEKHVAITGAAICRAISCAMVRNFSERATKSVSQLTSTITPTRPSPWE